MFMTQCLSQVSADFHGQCGSYEMLWTAMSPSYIACRSANLMSALAAMMVPGAADALLSPAIQLTAMLASDMAAAAEFAARGGVIGLMALVSDSTDTEVLPADAQTMSMLQTVRAFMCSDRAARKCACVCTHQSTAARSSDR